MNVEKILWTMSNWDCTSIMCTQCSVAKFCKQKTGLSNTRKATVWIQRSRRPTLVIYASTRWIPKPTSTTTIKECIKPSGAFWCASCKSFINHQQMTKHQKIHENFHDCNKSFGARRNMKRHMKNVHKARNEMKELKWITHGRKFEWRSNWQCTIWHSVLMTDARNDILEALRFHRQPRSPKSGYFCELNSTGASEV